MYFYTTRTRACLSLLVFTAVGMAVLFNIATAKSRGVDLVITNSAPQTVLAGLPVTFTITLRNDGDITASNVVLTDPLPTGAMFGKTSSSCISFTTCITTLQYSPDLKLLTFTINSVGPKTNVTLHSTMTTTLPMSLTNVAYVISDAPDDMPADNVATDTVSVTGHLLYAPMMLQAAVAP